MADEVENTFDKLKAGAKAVAKKVTDPGKDLGDEYDKERGKENSRDYEQTKGSGTNDPMSPEKIVSHDPQQSGEIPIRVLVGNLSQVRVQIILTFKASKWEQVLLNQTNQRRVCLRPSVVKNVGKHLAHVRN